jgi:hypothetical protein
MVTVSPASTALINLGSVFLASATLTFIPRLQPQKMAIWNTRAESVHALRRDLARARHRSRASGGGQIPMHSQTQHPGSTLETSRNSRMPCPVRPPLPVTQDGAHCRARTDARRLREHAVDRWRRRRRFVSSAVRWTKRHLTKTRSCRSTACGGGARRQRSRAARGWITSTASFSRCRGRCDGTAPSSRSVRGGARCLQLPAVCS